MVKFLQGRLYNMAKVKADGSAERIASIEYRNLAPLYAEEEMKICIKRKDHNEVHGNWDVWIEGRDGGYAVKGVVKTNIVSTVPREPDEAGTNNESHDVLINH